ncbi:MAG TPA: SDR family oxidoreductase [Terriglobales bacterium]|nr:SDR family oxidoreductase [Terriglobales bacterium]
MSTNGNARSQTVLITGSSSGIGRLAAETLARAGHTVYASMRQLDTRNRKAAESLLALSATENLRLRVIELDVSKSESVTKAMTSLLQEAGTLDVLVNNAGHMAIGITEAFTEAQAAEQIDVNFLGAVRLCRAVLPHMRQRGSGLIIHISSIVGRVLFPACAFYCASKFALEAYAEVLHYELTGSGVESVIVQPGPFPTHLLANSPAPDDHERASTYGSIAEIRTMFMDVFEKFFASAQTTNPQAVADAIAQLVSMPAGQRPLRTVCGPDYGARAINAHTTPIQAEVLRALGMTEMAERALGITEKPGEKDLAAGAA